MHDDGTWGQVHNFWSAVGAENENTKPYYGFKRIYDKNGDLIGTMNKPGKCVLELDIQINVVRLMRSKSDKIWDNKMPDHNWKWVEGHEQNHVKTWSNGYYGQVKKLNKYDGAEFDTSEATLTCLDAILSEMNRLKDEAFVHSQKFDNYGTQNAFKGKANPGRYDHDKFKGELDWAKLKEACGK